MNNGNIVRRTHGREKFGKRGAHLPGKKRKGDKLGRSLGSLIAAEDKAMGRLPEKSCSKRSTSKD